MLVTFDRLYWSNLTALLSGGQGREEGVVQSDQEGRCAALPPEECFRQRRLRAVCATWN
jgi:hypothetical protein